MPEVMKTLLLNPPSFENFDGGASSRWPATREIESYWYPVWLTYPAGMIPGSRLVDASPHKVNWQQTVEICKDYEFLVLFTSTVGLQSDLKLIRKIKEANPGMKIAFVGPHGHIKPDETLNASEDIDFVTRGEFDYSVTEYAHGRPPGEILGVSYRKDGKIVHNPERPQLHTEELDACRSLRTSTSAIWKSSAITSLSCCIPLFPSIPPGDVRRFVPSACGRKPFPGTPGGLARPTTWHGKSSKRLNTSRK